MPTLLNRLSDVGFRSLYKRSIVGEFDGIPLVSLHSDPDAFVQGICSSLKLIKGQDQRRFHRITQQTQWLVDSPLAGGAYSGSYQHRIKAIRVDFEFDESVGDRVFHVAYFAKVIVHEATHGVIRDRGIETTPENRIQVERICRAEENRFIVGLRRSFPDLPEDLICQFDPDDWSESWDEGAFRRFSRELCRGNQKSKKREQDVHGNTH